MKKLITSILTIVMVMSSISVFAKDYSNYKQKFWDVPKTHWAFEAVSELVDKNVINGYEDGSFKPDRTVNRGEWAKMMVTAANLDISDNTTVHCSDLVNHWSNRYVNAAINYLPSYNDGTYRPDMMITRDVVTASMVRLKGYNIEDVDYSILSQFRDVETIGNYMKAYVAVAVEKGLISGFEDNTFRGQDTLTRAEAATILNRAFQLGDNNIQMDVNNQSSGNNSDIGYDGFKPEPTKKPDKEDNKTNVEDKNNTQNEDKDENNKTNKDEEKDNVKDEIKENKKGYKIETLSKVNMSNGQYTFGNDKLYYYDDGKKEIVQIDVNTKDKETKSIDDFSTMIDEDEYKIKEIKLIEFNDYTNELNIICELYVDNILSSKLYENLISINLDFDIVNMDVKRVDTRGNIIKQIPDYYRQNLLGLNDEGNMIYGRDTSHSLFSMIEKNGNTYYGSSGGVIKDDYNTQEYIITLESDIGTCVGFSNDYIYLIQRNYNYPDNYRYIIKADYNGKGISKIDFNDIEIKDKKYINLQEIYGRIFVSHNEDIVIYDNTNQCFRMISKND